MKKLLIRPLVLNAYATEFAEDMQCRIVGYCTPKLTAYLVPHLERMLQEFAGEIGKKE